MYVVVLLHVIRKVQNNEVALSSDAGEANETTQTWSWDEWSLSF